MSSPFPRKASAALLAELVVEEQAFKVENILAGKTCATCGRCATDCAFGNHLLQVCVRDYCNPNAPPASTLFQYTCRDWRL